jgi:hypothetical protein
VLGPERSDGDKLDVRTAPEEFALDDPAQGDFTKLTGVERPEEPDHRPLLGTVHVMPPWLRADRGRPSRLRSGSGNARNVQ